MLVKLRQAYIYLPYVLCVCFGDNFYLAQERSNRDHRSSIIESRAKRRLFVSHALKSFSHVVHLGHSLFFEALENTD